MNGLVDIIFERRHVIATAVQRNDKICILIISFFFFFFATYLTRTVHDLQ